MPGDPHQCRLHASRCRQLAEFADTAKSRSRLIALAEMWERLAAELDSEDALLKALSEIVPQPYEVLPKALNLNMWEASGSLLFLPRQ